MLFRMPTLLTFLAVFFFGIQLVLGAPLYTGSETYFECNENDTNNCPVCYNVLVDQLLKDKRNLYNLQVTFFPPDLVNPIFVEVIYCFTSNFSDSECSNDVSFKDKWYWTTSAFYLYQPITSLFYTSLMFADSHLRRDTVKLYLPLSCYSNVTEEYPPKMQVLTQRLKLYARQERVATDTTIDDDYNPKAASLRTLTSFHINGPNTRHWHSFAYTNYSLALQVLFPIIAALGFLLLLGHLFGCNSIHRIQQMEWPDNWQLDGGHTNGQEASEKQVFLSSKNLHILMAIIFSLTFMGYVLVMDCLALGWKHLDAIGEIFLSYPSQEVNETFHENLRVEYAIPIVMLFQDFISILAFGIFIVAKLLLDFCTRCKEVRCNENNWPWYTVLVGPLLCIAVHSFHILVSFVHAPYHATGIFSFYGIVFFVYIYTFRSSYYCLAYLIKKCDCCCCITRHSRENYCIAMISCFLSLLSPVLMGVIIAVVFLFILVPINMAVEDVPNRLSDVNQSIIVLIGVAVTYKLFVSPKTNDFVKMLVKAKERGEQHISTNTQRGKEIAIENMLYKVVTELSKLKVD